MDSQNTASHIVAERFGRLLRPYPVQPELHRLAVGAIARIAGLVRPKPVSAESSRVVASYFYHRRVVSSGCLVNAVICLQAPCKNVKLPKSLALNLTGPR